MTKSRPTKKQKVRTYERKADVPVAIMPVAITVADEPITPREYGGLQAAFSYLNTKLFGGMLPNVVIVLQRRAHSGGHFSPGRFSSRVGNRGYDEISLNPDGFIGRTDEWIVSILLHEMVHLWQEQFGKRPGRGYHDKQWAAKMESLGLMPSNSGMIGGKRTGQQMAHYVIENGAYATAFAALAATGWKLNLQSAIHAGGTKKPDDSKTKFTCPGCGWIVRAKPDTEVIHKPCMLDMLPERPTIAVDSPSIAAVQSYDQEPTTPGIRVGLIIRGYEIDEVKDGYTIKKDGAVVCDQPTKESAIEWEERHKQIEEEKRKEIEAAEREACNPRQGPPI